MDRSLRRTPGGEPTRRTLLRGAVMTAGSMLLLGLPGCKHKEEPSQTAPKKATPCNGSVFCTSCGPNDPSKGYDYDAVYGIFSVWLMLTTEEWGPCLRDPNWRKQLADAFKVDLNELNNLYERTTRQTSSNNTYSNRDLFAHLKTIWQRFKVETLKLAPGTIYPGGTFLRQIAYKFQSMPASTFLQESCGGGASNSPAVGYGPIAFWLMLVTEDWKACLQQENDPWRDRLAGEFNMPKDALYDLYKRSEDTSLVGPSQRYSNQRAFLAARVEFQQWLASVNPITYGGRPCAGGLTLLQIARGGK